MSLASCALALILLVDVSSSIDLQELNTQRNGLMQALLDPATQSVILDQPGGVAIAYVEWETLPTIVVNWRHIQTANHIKSLVDEIELKSVKDTNIHSLTGMGDAVNKAVDMFNDAPCSPERKVIDISGDGASNVNTDIEPARQRAQQHDIIINGFPIVSEIVEYYRNKVITPGGFIVEIQENEDFFRAMRRKLIMEISNLVPWLKLDNDKAL